MIKVPMRSDPELRSRAPFGSNFRTYRCPVESWISTFGVYPESLRRSTRHGTGRGAAPSRPLTASSNEIGRIPIRFVNQVESGTSSQAFTLSDGTYFAAADSGL